MLLGLDVGTSSLKATVLREDGEVVFAESAAYSVSAPRESWAEQDPQSWYQAMCDSCRAIPQTLRDEVRAVALSGQMHGIVCIGANGQVLRPAIIWADRRTGPEIGDVGEAYGWDEYCKTTRNRPSTGFGILSLRWLAKHEPETLLRTSAVLCPKDYLRFRLCGEIGIDYSDASGLGCLDMDTRTWATQLINSLEIPTDLFPPISGAWEEAGRILATAGEDTGLPKSRPVYFGGADACMQGVGNGIARPGTASSNIGTAGQVATFADRLVYDRLYRTNTFCHVIPDSWTIFGATLSAGRCLSWLEGITNVPVADMIGMAEGISPGADGLVFLPYLNGERAPHADPLAAGVFWGLTHAHTGSHLARAVMEGVCLSLMDCLSLLVEVGVPIETIVAAGGGSRSDVWVQMQADVFGLEVTRVRGEGDASLGAAVVAGYGCGSFNSITEGCEAVAGDERKVFHPDKGRTSRYRELLAQFRETYQANKELFKTWRRT